MLARMHVCCVACTFSNYQFQFKRAPTSVKQRFAITINKSQVRTPKKSEIDLSTERFARVAFKSLQRCFYT